MNNNISLITVFIASPSDVADERSYAQSAIDTLNQTLGKERCLRIESKMWEKDTYPSIGSYPQEVINNQIGTYDIFVGIMSTKFGSPTNNAESGTEEEFNRAYDNYRSDGQCKNLMFYFCNDPVPRDRISQIGKIDEFKNKIAQKGIYYKEYPKDSFRNLFYEDLYNCIVDLLPQNDYKPESEYKPTELLDNFQAYLEDIGVNFTHPMSDKICFDDVFVPFNLRDITENSHEHTRINVEVLTSAIEADGILYHIKGNDRSGKTTLCKYFFERYYDQNLYPILLNGSDFTNNTRADKLLSIIKSKIGNQYKSITKTPTSNKTDNYDFVLIVDNFQYAGKGNVKYWKLLTSNLEALFSNIIIVGDSTISMENLSANPPFENYNKYSIMPFGADLRSQLVEKWYSIGQDLSLESKNGIRLKMDNANKNIKAILGKNIVPSYPFYILGILQSIEAGNQNISHNYSLHGFYYEQLINTSLAKAIVNTKDISFYYNFLVLFCYNIFEQKLSNRTSAISIETFDEIYRMYCENFDIDTTLIGIVQVKDTLKKSKLLVFDNNVSVSEKYIYYFFVAKYIANNIDKKEIQEVVTKLCDRIFNKEYSNIIMFVTHLSKHNWIIQTLLKNANSIFDTYQESLLENDIKGINDLINDVPTQVIKAIDVDKERDSQLKLQTELEERQDEFDKDETNYADFSLDDDISDIDLVAKVNLAVKTIDILGQIAIKYWGELGKDIKYQIIEATYSVGLRTLSMYLTTMSDNKKELIEYISNVIIEDRLKKESTQWKLNDIDRDEIKKISIKYILSLSFLASWAIINRVSYAVGDNRLMPTFEKILANHPQNSYKLINQSIKLNYPAINIDIIKEYSNDLRTNPMCFKLLQNLVVRHLYMFDEDYKVKSQIEAFLKIKIGNQRYIQGSSHEKR